MSHIEDKKNRFIFFVPAISCADCARTIENALKALYLVEHVNINITDKLAIVDGDALTEKKLRSVLEDIGFDDGLLCLNISDDASNQINRASFEQAQRAQQQAERRTQIRRLLASGPLALSLLLVSALGLTIPSVLLLPLTLVCTLVTAYAGWPIFKRAYKKIKHGQLTMDSLFSLSSLIATAVTLASLIFPLLPFQATTALMILAARHLGQLIEHSIKRKILPRSFCAALPSDCFIYKEAPIQRRCDAIKLGDVIIAYQGQLIPFDGKVISGNASVKRTLLTGQRQAKQCKKGETLLAGMPIESGSVRLKVTALQADCHLAKLDNAIQQVAESKPNISQLASSIIKYFIPSVLLLSLCSAVLMSIFAAPLIGLNTGLSMLVAACPCTLGLIIPLAMKVGAKQCADHAIRVHSAQALEQASQVKDIVFDLHGTLTSDYFELMDNGQCSDQHYRMIESLELAKIEQTPSPIAHALLTFAKERQSAEKTPPPAASLLANHSTLPGVAAEIEGTEYYFGNAQLLAQYKIAPPSKPKTGHQLYLASKEQGIIASFTLKVQLAKGARAVSEELKRRGYRLHICTGASQAIAEDFSEQLGIDLANVYADCVGVEAKKKCIEEKLNLRQVAMIGDGYNDALLLSASTLGVAVACADEVNKQHADVALESDDLTRLLPLFTTAKNTMQLVKQNLLISFIYNLISVSACVLCASFLGALSAPLMASLMTVQALIILANTYRLQTSPKTKQNQPQDTSESQTQQTTLTHHTNPTPSPRPPIPAPEQPPPPSCQPPSDNFLRV